MGDARHTNTFIKLGTNSINALYLFFFHRKNASTTRIQVYNPGVHSYLISGSRILRNQICSRNSDV